MYNGISEFVHRKPFELDNFQMRWRRRFADSVFRLSSFFFPFPVPSKIASILLPGGISVTQLSPTLMAARGEMNSLDFSC